MKKVAVTIPVYKPEPERDDIASLRQCAKILGRHPVIFFAPESLDVAPYSAIIPQAAIERFADEYFTGIPGYNRLMLSTQFYNRFAEWDFILIYQSDAWVFRDELDYWCEQKHDYIGAPVFPRDWGDYGGGEMIVGNGGLSLRRISSFLRVLNDSKGRMYQFPRLCEFVRNHLKGKHKWRAVIPLLRMTGLFNRRIGCMKKFSSGNYNEDMIFHELSSSYTSSGLEIAPLSAAMRFSWEKNSATFFGDSYGNLPFGCHAWRRYEFDTFWSKHIVFPDWDCGNMHRGQ